MDVAVLLGDAAGRLAAAGVENPRREARLLLGYAAGVSPDDLLGAFVLTQAGLGRFEDFLLRRVAREPFAYITGSKEFWSIEFEVGAGALVPRPETETLLEQALKAFPDRAAPLEVLDLGTGTGCLLIAFLSEYPNARGTGIDSSAEALGWARRNLAKHGLEERSRLIAGDWAGGHASRYNVILSNPPYIPTGDIAGLAPEVTQFEPIAALDGGPDGLDAYRALAPRIAQWLKPGGQAFLEFGAGQEEAVAAILAAQGLSSARITVDLAGIQRCAAISAAPRKQLENEG